MKESEKDKNQDKTYEEENGGYFIPANGMWKFLLGGFFCTCVIVFFVFFITLFF